MACLSCGRGFHDECQLGCLNCHPDYQKATQNLSATGGRSYYEPKDPEDVKDKFSTGRKRAAFLYPLFKDKACEWQRLKNCGGGLSPIVGCIDGLQQTRHHGPVKQVLRNEPGNVHRICHNCHNRWHARNNPIYDEDEYNKLPHRPEEATDLELMSNEAEWRLKK